MFFCIIYPELNATEPRDTPRGLCFINDIMTPRESDGDAERWHKDRLSNEVATRLKRNGKSTNEKKRKKEKGKRESTQIRSRPRQRRAFNPQLKFLACFSRLNKSPAIFPKRSQTRKEKRKEKDKKEKEKKNQNRLRDATARGGERGRIVCACGRNGRGGGEVSLYRGIN